MFGISQNEVTPPATAASDPEARSSLWGNPGSRKCTWGSISPGSTMQPDAYTTSFAPSGRQALLDGIDHTPANPDIGPDEPLRHPRPAPLE